MTNVRTATLALTLLLTAGSAAQEQTPKTPTPAENPIATPSTRNGPQLANVRIEISIAEEGQEPLPPRTVTLVVSDGHTGRVRSGIGSVLNVDARPTIARDGRIQLYTSLEYTVPQDQKRPALHLTESLSTLLESGKPLVASQSADPVTDRRVRLELKATILK